MIKKCCRTLVKAKTLTQRRALDCDDPCNPGDKVLTLTENQTTYVPLGKLHRLKTPDSITLEIFEIQSGGYLG